ncbi:MAG: hypothetical protein WC623_24275 [Pedobacter sp.]|uniref:hypothetical protein n=1 Tax=Pedobacter sp. TaxID=1411316 RepID=UPI003568F668
MTKKEFVKKMLFLGEILSDKPSEIKIEGYWEMYQDCSDKLLLKAFWNARKCRFFPKPVEFDELMFLDDDEIISRPQLEDISTKEWHSQYMKNTREMRQQKLLKQSPDANSLVVEEEVK